MYVLMRVTNGSEATSSLHKETYHAYLFEHTHMKS